MKELLESAELDKEAIDFSLVKIEEFIPCLEHAIKEAYISIDAYKKRASDDFYGVILSLEELTEEIEFISSLFSFYHGTLSTDEFQEISSEFTQKLTEFYNELSLDDGIFQIIKNYYDSKPELSEEEQAVLESYYIDFTRNGSLLSEEKKAELKKINEEQGQVSLNFSKNVLKYNNDYYLNITDEAKLAGLPQSAIDAAKRDAKSKDLSGWVFTLDYPSYLPVMTYASSRDLREELYRAKALCATEGELDNKPNILRALELREKRASLLGYKNHAEFVLERRMAQSPKTVLNFLEDLKVPALKKAKIEAKELISLFHEDFPGEKIQAWDRGYYAEKLKQKQLDFDEEELRPYFSLENVIDGAFKTASVLYQIQFKKREDLPKYHDDVQIFEVQDLQGEYVGLFYADFFPRATKRSGAWMTNLRSQGYRDGEIKRPHVGIVCNFTKPTEDKPSLLTLNEVLTLFHEFGHALHGLLSDVKYAKLSGTSVYWDFVELPSQIMENWVYEKECLDTFAKHYQTGEVMPKDLIDKVVSSQHFLTGIGSLRQLSFATLDMKYHLIKASDVEVDEFEQTIFKDFDVYGNDTKIGNMSCSFGHVFAGGYAAGYYSYKWAEVLDADAFAVFKEKGIFNTEVASSFKKNILSQGGTKHPMELYKQFKGGEPSVDALLKRSGLV